MALADYDAFKAAFDGHDPFFFQALIGNNNSTPRLTSSHTLSSSKRASSSAVACDKDTPNNIFENQAKPTSASGTYYIAGMELWPRKSAATVVLERGSLMLIDRLCEQSGLVGNSAATQTTNLPTAALTRYTTGEGVHMALEVFGAIGGTAQDVTVAYTNQAGTASRTNTRVRLGGAEGSGTKSFVPVPLQQGDTGVRSVESFALAATTGSAGDIGIVLYKPLLILPRLVFSEDPLVRPCKWNAALGGEGRIISVSQNACLQFLGAMTTGDTVGISGKMFTLDA